MKPLHELTASEIARAIAAGQTTATAVAEDCLSRIAQREPQVGAWEFLDPELVLRQARALDAAGPRGPLHGVPVGIKDIIDTADMPTAYGSPIHAGHRPHMDAVCVALTRRAGGLIMGKTVTTEFANRHPGKTRHPRDPLRTPGGSSSGSGAAVGDAMVPLALGSLQARSVILSAALPTGSLVFVLAYRYGLYVERSTSVILISTVLSGFTLSALLLLLGTG